MRTLVPSSALSKVDRDVNREFSKTFWLIELRETLPFSNKKYCHFMAFLPSLWSFVRSVCTNLFKILKHIGSKIFAKIPKFSGNFPPNYTSKLDKKRLNSQICGILDCYKEQKNMSEPVLNDRKIAAAKISKREKFVKLAESRTVNAIKAIRIIGKLGNRNAYEYDEADVRKIVKALNDEIEALKNRMKTTESADGVDFKL